MFFLLFSFLVEFIVRKEIRSLNLPARGEALESKGFRLALPLREAVAVPLREAVRGVELATQHTTAGGLQLRTSRLERGL